MTDEEFEELHKKLKQDSASGNPMHLFTPRAVFQQYFQEVEKRLGISEEAKYLNFVKEVQFAHKCCADDDCTNCPYNDINDGASCTMKVVDGVQSILQNVIAEKSAELDKGDTCGVPPMREKV